MLGIHEALKRCFQTLEDTSVTGFHAQSKFYGVHKCFPSVISYCADITEAENLCSENHVLVVLRPCHTLCKIEKMSRFGVGHRSHTAALHLNVAKCRRLMKEPKNIRKL